MGEPAWNGAGEAVGLKIWRVVVSFCNYLLKKYSQSLQLATCTSGVLSIKLSYE